jgi:ATP-dependent protease ClpP protease subunit
MSAPNKIVAPTAQLDTVYITFSAEINAHTTESLMATISGLVNKRVKKIYLALSTPGGVVMHGLTLYNYLRAIPSELVIHNIGNVDSIGNAVFLAAEASNRLACAHSTFMFHGVGRTMPQGVRLEEKLLRECINSIEVDQKRIGQILQERTQITPEQTEILFLEAQTKDATYAVGCGIVHQISDFKIPVGGPVISLVFQR